MTTLKLYSENSPTKILYFWDFTNNKTTHQEASFFLLQASNGGGREVKHTEKTMYLDEKSKA